MDNNISILQFFVIEYGVVLFGYALWFWITYGHPIYKIRLPPITTLVTFIVLIIMLLLMSKTIQVKVIFGTEETVVRKNILDLIGVIFTGFILMITIFWALMAGKVKLVSRTVYHQSYLLVLLFFYIGLAVYCILANIKFYLT